jgi:hypothetical protein
LDAGVSLVHLRANFGRQDKAHREYCQYVVWKHLQEGAVHVQITVKVLEATKPIGERTGLSINIVVLRVSKTRE